MNHWYKIELQRYYYLDRFAIPTYNDFGGSEGSSEIMTTTGNHRSKKIFDCKIHFFEDKNKRITHFFDDNKC